MPSLFWISILLCLIAGAAIDTSQICLVRASDQLVRGRPAIALGILVVTACASVVFWLNTAFATHHRTPYWSYPSWITVAGAVMFALGTLLNGACAIGTIGHLCRGEVGRIAALLGAGCAVWLFPHLLRGRQLPGAPITSNASWLMAVLAGTAVMLILGRRHLRHGRLGSFILLGITAAVITDWQGDWTWMSLVQELQIGKSLQYEALAAVAAVAVGAAALAAYKGRFRLVRPAPMTMAKAFAGGGMMAVGASLIPGANDALSVYSVPSGSPHALVGYLTIAATMLGAAAVKLATGSHGALAGRNSEA